MMAGSLHRLYIDRESGRQHLVLELPSRSSTEFEDHVVAVPKQLDVELDVFDRFAGDVDVRDRMWEVIRHLADRRDLERCADDDDEIRFLSVLRGEAVEEGVRQLLAEEGDVWLHHTWLRNVVVLARVVRGEAAAGLLALHRAGSQLAFADVFDAALAVGYLLGADIVEDLASSDLKPTFAAGGHREAAVALDDATGLDAGELLQVVNVLGVVRLKSVFVLQQLDEAVRGRETLLVGEDIACQGVKDAVNMRGQSPELRQCFEGSAVPWILIEIPNIEDLLRIRVSHRADLFVKSGSSRAKVWNAERCRDACSSDHHDLAAALEKLGCVVDVVVLREFLASVKGSHHDHSEQAEEGFFVLHGERRV